MIPCDTYLGLMIIIYLCWSDQRLFLFSISMLRFDLKQQHFELSEITFKKSRIYISSVVCELIFI